MQFKQKTNIIKMLIITALLTVTTSFVSLAAQHSQKLESHLYATAYDDMHNNGGHQENGNQVLEASIGNTIGMSREGFNTVNNSTLLVMDVSHFYSTRYGLGYNTYDGYSKAGSFEFRKSNG